MKNRTTSAHSARNQDRPGRGEKGPNPGSATSQLTTSGRSLRLSKPHVFPERRSVPFVPSHKTGAAAWKRGCSPQTTRPHRPLCWHGVRGTARLPDFRRVHTASEKAPLESVSSMPQCDRGQDAREQTGHRPVRPLRQRLRRGSCSGLPQLTPPGAGDASKAQSRRLHG